MHDCVKLEIHLKKIGQKTLKTVKNYLIDTNVVVRFFIRDDEAQYLQSLKWFAEAEKGKINVAIIPIVVAEICFVLESFYKISRTQISEYLEVFLAEKWIQVEDRNILLGVFDKYRLGEHFVDSFLLQKSQTQNYHLMTFDKKLLKALRKLES